MTFTCRQCGSCCMYMGDYIVIDREMGPFEFECLSVSTGTPFKAVIDEDKRDLYLDRAWISRHPHACRFLRPSGPDRIVCTIHETSATQCKLYRCVVMRVFSEKCGLSGTVTGTLALHSEDHSLRATWEKMEQEIPVSGPDAEKLIACYLEGHGYKVL
jgi:Fe-S-cluster containining protein